MNARLSCRLSGRVPVVRVLVVRMPIARMLRGEA